MRKPNRLAFWLSQKIASIGEHIQFRAGILEDKGEFALYLTPTIGILYNGTWSLVFGFLWFYLDIEFK